MAIFGSVFENLIAVAVIAVFGWLMYKSMKGGKVKDAVSGLLKFDDGEEHGGGGIFGRKK